MHKFYCAGCADALGKRPSWWATVDPLGTQYQRDKHQKHTSVSPVFPELSVFDSTSTPYYADCVRETLEKGAVQVGSRGTNALYCPSIRSDIGSRYQWGQLAKRQDAVLVVIAWQPNDLHARPEQSSNYSGQRCDSCGGPIL